MDRFDEEIESLIDAVIRCAIAVHKSLRPGHAESVFANALAVEMTHEGIPFEREHRFQVMYRDQLVGEGRIDFWVGGRLVVELKTARTIDPAHVSQVVGYLAHKGEPVGLLLNFSAALMKQGIRRVVHSKDL